MLLADVPVPDMIRTRLVSMSALPLIVLQFEHVLARRHLDPVPHRRGSAAS